MIQNSIRVCLQRLREERKTRGEWSDAGGGPGLLKMLEAQECFLAAALSIPDLARIIDWDTMAEDLEAVFRTIEEDGFCPSPYLDEDLANYRKNVTDFVDTVSFATTTALDFLTLRRKQNLPWQDFTNVGKLITRGVEWLAANAIVRTENDRTIYCWASGNQVSRLAREFPSVYFTWSAIVALWEVWKADPELIREFSDDSDSGEHGVEDLKEYIVGAYAWFEEIIDRGASSEEPGQATLKIKYLRLADTENINPQVLLVYFLGVAEAAHDCGLSIDQTLVVDVARTLMSSYEKARDDFDVGFHIATIFWNARGSRTSAMYEDRSLPYLLLEGLCWSHEYLGESGFDDPQFRDKLKKTADDLREFVISQQDRKTGTWTTGSYQIYYNQRAVEALLYYLDKFGEPPQAVNRVINWDENIRRAVEQILDSTLATVRRDLLEKLEIEVAARGMEMLPDGLSRTRPEEREALLERAAGFDATAAPPRGSAAESRGRRTGKKEGA